MIASRAAGDVAAASTMARSQVISLQRTTLLDTLRMSMRK